MTVLFADVAGSVELYESLGDVEAHNAIVESQKAMTKVIEQYQGWVVEVIGDEIMSAFPLPDYALNAACKIQEMIHEGTCSQVSIRIGFNSGPTAMDDGHPFGDTVNVAARMVALAKAGQIIISQYSYMKLSEFKRRQTRHFKRMLLKGKQTPVDVHEIVWDNDLEYTKQLSSVHSASFQRNPISSVQLIFKDRKLKVKDPGSEVSIGRGTRCNIRILSDMASRLHAIVKCENGKILLEDQSTNGTYIKTRSGNRSHDDQELFLHNEDWLMASSGFISLGVPIEDHNPDLIFFRCS